MLSERFEHRFQWYWMYVLIATDGQCGSGTTGLPLIDQYGDDSLRVQDDVSESC